MSTIAAIAVAALGVAGVLPGAANPAPADASSSYMLSKPTNDTVDQDVIAHVRRELERGVNALQRERSSAAEHVSVATATSAGLTGTPATGAGQYIAAERRHVLTLDQQIAGLTRALRDIDIAALGDCRRDGHPTQRTRNC